MRAWSDYDKTQAYGDFRKLPKGGYVLKILDARMDRARNGNSFIAVSCDIAEGEYKGFFMDKWNNDTREDRTWGCVGQVWEPLDDGSEKDGWTKKAFKTFMVAVEDSNDGYHWDWDERKLKDKLVGGLFHISQFIGTDGNVHETVKLKSWTTVENIRSGNYELPKDKLVETSTAAPASSGGMNEGFMEIPDSADDNGLPFK